MNFICLSYSSILFNINFFILSCYAVVNLLLLPSTDGALVVTLSTERVGGLKCVFGIIWLLRNQVLLAFAPLAFAGVGGLKWTRTIDLTLIRRVL